MFFTGKIVDVPQTLDLPIILGINAPPKCCIDRKLSSFGEFVHFRDLPLMPREYECLCRHSKFCP